MAKKKQHEYQYTLNIFPYFDEKKKREVIRFVVQTVRIFVHFRYEILLSNSIKDNIIQLNIEGLHVPTILLPESGPAVGIIDYENLYGTYTLNVTKQNGSLNTFTLNIDYNNTVTIEPKTKSLFILASTTSVIYT